MEALPNEIILEIFRYLHDLDKKAVRLVCRKFRNIAWDPVLAKNNLIRLRDEPLLDEAFRYRKMRVFTVVPLQRSNFYRLRGHDITYLYIEVRECPNLWIQILQYVPNLEYLKLENVSTNFDVPTDFHLEKLRGLEVILGLNACGLLLSITRLPIQKLEKLWISDVNFEERINDTTAIELFLQLIENSKLSLKSFAALDIRVQDNITPLTDYLVNCLQKIGPQLKELAVPKLDDVIINIISHNFPDLRYLRELMEHEYKDIQNLDAKARKLRNFVIPLNHKLFDSNFLTNKSRYLEELVIQNASSSVLKTLIEKNTFSNLKELSLMYPCSNEIIEEFLQRTPSLIKLHVRNKSEFNDETLKIICQKCPQLRYLNISRRNCYISDFSHLNLLKGLLEFHIISESDDGDDDYEDDDYYCLVNDDGVSRLSLPELRILDIKYCTNITDYGVQNIISQCLALREISLFLEFDSDFHTERSCGLVSMTWDEDTDSDYDYNYHHWIDDICRINQKGLPG